MNDKYAELCRVLGIYLTLQNQHELGTPEHKDACELRHELWFLLEDARR